MSGPAPEPRHLPELDLRAVLEAGGDPWPPVRAALERLPSDGVLALFFAELPAGLRERLEQHGCRLVAGPSHGRLRSVAALAPDAPRIADLRELPPPEPLEAVLLATARLAPGESFLARTPRYPRMLLPRLEERGLAFEVREERDGTALVHVRRPR